MKVIKRDGHMVDYCPEKIEQAIMKANKEVEEEDQASSTQIKNIIKYIEKLGKKRILVEDIQDIIEMKLMSQGKYELAKHYIRDFGARPVASLYPDGPKTFMIADQAAKDIFSSYLF